MVIKAGICVAYDWAFLEHSLPAIYKYMDNICLSIDAEHKSWNGNHFDIDMDALRNLVERIDVSGKITLLCEPFYAETRRPIENECFQRARMAEVLGTADWIVQIDTDEIIVNPEDFITLMKRYDKWSRPINIHGIWANLIKQTSKGFVYSISKTPPLATNRPVYEYGRTNGNFNVYSNVFLAHITWARPENEVFYKLNNWGHSHEFNGQSFFKMWQALDDFNWIYLKNFRPMSTGQSDHVYYQDAKSIDEFIASFDRRKHQLPAQALLFNNLWLSRMRKLLHRKNK